MRKKFVFIAIALLFIGLGIGGSLIGTNLDKYYGNLVFNTEEDYSAFKQELVDADAYWENENMQVLSSAPPIIVRMHNVVVDKKYDFKYGEKVSESFEYSMTGIGVLVCIILVYFIFSIDNGKLWLFKNNKE